MNTQPLPSSVSATLFSRRLEHGLRLAARWHDGQYRKKGDVPYVQHVIAVALILERLGFDEEVVLAGLLHDAIEDTAATHAEIAAALGPSVASLVEYCTERKLDELGRLRPWAERKREHLALLARAPIEARAVALADKLHNLASMRSDLEEGAELWSRFNASRDDVLNWYRVSIEQLGQTDPRDDRLERLGAECLACLDEVERLSSRPCA